MKDLNIRPETLKLVQERVGNTLEHISKDNDFLNRTPMVWQLRERNDKWNYRKLKSFCTAKEMITSLKRQPIEWKKISASCTSDKGLITRIYKELKKIKLLKNQ
jgi:phage-related protein